MTTKTKLTSLTHGVDNDRLASEAVKRDDRNERLRTAIQSCQTLRDTESAEYAAFIEGTDDGGCRGLQDAGRRITSLRNGVYPHWDSIVEQLRTVYRERGEDPRRADQFAPNRARLTELNTKAFHSR